MECNETERATTFTAVKECVEVPEIKVALENSRGADFDFAGVWLHPLQPIADGSRGILVQFIVAGLWLSKTEHVFVTLRILLGAVLGPIVS